MAGGGALVVAGARTAEARGRSGVGGRVQLRVPWPLGAVDPHRLDDGCAALFGSALFDTLYVAEEAGYRASLAEGPPEVLAGELRVRLRQGLITASGRPLVAGDVVASIARARAAGAHAWLADLQPPRKLDDLTVAFTATREAGLLRALSSPLCAVVPAGFRPEAPDGTGPMRALLRRDGLTLVRNVHAARGPSLLGEVAAYFAPDLASSLRAFESGTDEIGWLGAGLHEPRAGSVPFDAGCMGWAVLRTGAMAGVWDAPGTAQRLCDGISPATLSHLALGAAWETESDQGWGGPPADLLVRADAPWLVELAGAVAATLSRPGHEVTARPCAAAAFVQQRAARSYALAIDLVRPLFQDADGALASLASSSDMALALDVLRHPPRLRKGTVRSLTRTLRVGVLGDLRAKGARRAELVLPSMPEGGIDWSGASLARPR